MKWLSTKIDIIPEVKFTDITDYVAEYVYNCNVRRGIAIVSSPHTTACIRLLENEELLKQDMEDFLERLAPCRIEYRHDDIEHRTVPPDERRNGFAHLHAMLLNHQEIIPINSKTLQLGQWQRIFYIDLDLGKKGRAYNILVIGGHSYGEHSIL
jgi:secondary thiamine-phosphate synthase enzyme